MSETQAIPHGGLGPTGIGGWLVLPMLGLFLSPLRALTLMRDYDGVSDALPLLSSAQAKFVVIEIGMNAFLLGLAPAVLLFMFFKRRKLFPMLYIGWAIFDVAFQILDLIVAGALFQELFGEDGVPLFDAEAIKEFMRSLFIAVIWVPYMAASRRVSNTFVH